MLNGFHTTIFFVLLGISRSTLAAQRARIRNHLERVEHAWIAENPQSGQVFREVEHAINYARSEEIQFCARIAQVGDTQGCRSTPCQ